MNEKDYDNILSEKELARIIHKNILHYHPDADDIPIADLYNRTGVETIGIVRI